jgi:RHS repeat-associated protein
MKPSLEDVFVEITGIEADAMKKEKEKSGIGGKSAADVNNCYYYSPFGGTTGSETEETVSNWYAYAGYFYDDSTGTYYCNARQYDFGRFTTRDPVRGTFKEPLTLHPYLYCLNDPINSTDPSGEFLASLAGAFVGNILQDTLRYSQYAYYAKAGSIAIGMTIDIISGYHTYQWASTKMGKAERESLHSIGRDPCEAEKLFNWILGKD